MISFDPERFERTPVAPSCDRLDCAQIRLSHTELSDQVSELQLMVQTRDEALDDYRTRLVDRSVEKSINQMRLGTKVLLFFRTLPYIGPRFRERLVTACQEAKIIA